jgi:hypothetical protein
MIVTLATNQNSFKKTKTSTSPSSSPVFVFWLNFCTIMTKKTQYKLDKGFFLGEFFLQKSSYFEEKNRTGHHHPQGDLPTFSYCEPVIKIKNY